MYPLKYLLGHVGHFTPRLGLRRKGVTGRASFTTVLDPLASYNPSYGLIEWFLRDLEPSLIF